MLSEILITEFFQKYLHKPNDSRKHKTIFFYDTDQVPNKLFDAFNHIEWTELVTCDSRTIKSQYQFLQPMYSPDSSYLSLFDIPLTKKFAFDKTAVAFSHHGKGLDFTSFELPRFCINKKTISETFSRIFSDDPYRQKRHADSFYQALSKSDVPYSVSVLSGHNNELKIVDREPWLEIAGPLQEGDNRFLPGAELFYGGNNINGVITCQGSALNLLPLRCDNMEINLCKQFLELGKQLQHETIHLHFSQGQLTDITPRSKLSDQFKKLLSIDPAFTQVVEVGIGLSQTARPLIYDWPATTNEAAYGVHVGLGADPGNPKRFKTAVHLDFVCPKVKLIVNDEMLFHNGKWKTNPTDKTLLQ